MQEVKQKTKKEKIEQSKLTTKFYVNQNWMPFYFIKTLSGHDDMGVFIPNNRDEECYFCFEDIYTTPYKKWSLKYLWYKLATCIKGPYYG